MADLRNGGPVPHYTTMRLLVHSGVFRTSVEEGRSAVGAEMGVCRGGAGPPPQKKIIFAPN